MTIHRDSFAQLSGNYAAWRPQYPAALFEWISGMCDGHESAWDCATGNGQAAIGLADHFTQVEATDVSEEQLAHALFHPRVHYTSAPAESPPFGDESFDLVTVAQALHWFDYSQFWPEVRRVSRPSAFFCAWGYLWPEGDSALEAEVLEPYRDALSPFWAKNNQILWDGYPSDRIQFPFQRVAAPDFTIEVEWTLPQLVAYMHTWSAYKLSDEAVKHALDTLVRQNLDSADASRTHRIRMPLTVVAGHVNQP